MADATRRKGARANENRFDELLKYLTAYNNKSVFEQCLKELAEKAVRIAYSSKSLREINQTLMGASTDTRLRLVSWLKRLGIKVVKCRETRGGYRAVAVEDPSKGHEMMALARSLPFNTTAVIVNKDTDKRWFDDLEEQERSHSVRALRGGRASGK